MGCRVFDRWIAKTSSAVGACNTFSIAIMPLYRKGLSSVAGKAVYRIRNVTQENYSKMTGVANALVERANETFDGDAFDSKLFGKWKKEYLNLLG